MLLFCDSFDVYGTIANLSKRWLSVGSNPSLRDNGRNGTKCLSFPYTSGAGTQNVNFGTGGRSPIIIGFAMNIATTGGIGQTGLTFYTGSDDTLQIGITSAGLITAIMHHYSSLPDVTLATSVRALTTNTWYYIEILMAYGVSGSVIVRVNGEEWLNYAGEVRSKSNAGGTTFFGVPNVCQMYFNGNALSSYVHIDDFVMLDDTGTVNNTFLGDVSVKAIYPTADVAPAAGVTPFSRSTGTSNFGNVDETDMNTTDYNYSAEVGAKDLLTFGDVTGNGSVKAVQLTAIANKSDTGTRAIKTVAKSGTAESESTDIYLGTSYAAYTSIFDTDPNTNAEWTLNKLNGANGETKPAFGYKVSV